MASEQSINRVLSEINKFNEQRGWSKFHSVKNLSMALSVEVAELIELSQWKTEQESNEPSAEELDKYKDEVADVFIYLLQISQKLKLDITEVALKKIIKNSVKYSVK